MESSPTPDQLALIRQLKPYAPDEATYGRMYADLHDLLQASAWLLDTFSQHRGQSLSASQVEALLLDIDVKFVAHSSYHLQTLRTDIESTLAGFPDPAANDATEQPD